MPTPFRAIIAASVLGAALLDVSPAVADDALPVDLTWVAPEECPTREGVLADIARERGLARAPGAHAVVRAEVTRDEHGRWRSALVVEAGNARSESCDAVAAAAALIVAVTIEAGATPAPPKVAAPALPVPSAPAAEAAAERAVSPAKPRPGRAADSKLLLSFAGVVDSGTLPVVAAGLEAAAGWSYGSAIWRGRLVAAGEYFPAETGAVPSRPGDRGHFTLVTASGRMCGSRVVSAFEIAPCLGAEFDSMTGQGDGSTTTLHGTAQWVALLGSVLAAWHPLRFLALSLRLDAVAPLARPTFVVQALGTDFPVHRPSAVAARAALGLEVRFF